MLAKSIWHYLHMFGRRFVRTRVDLSETQVGLSKLK